MQLNRMLVFAGIVIGLVPIILGIVGLFTPQWIKISYGTDNVLVLNQSYGLFICNPMPCPVSNPVINTVKGLEIAGVVIILVGVGAVVVLHLLIENRWVNLLPQIFLFTGPTLIFIGLILYGEAIILNFRSIYQLYLGYSMILMIISCIFGYLTAVYFAFVAAIGRHYQDQRKNTYVYDVITATQEPVRF